ncbi:MAG: ATP-binding cassette domain-containing protein, partial [Alicyclobacillus sp.]|nr:ATP-binding cassette domain-containing protein [Alicyclobacillus sp.]
FVLHEGEILGLGGLQGQGQQELLGALFGIQPIRAGSIRLFGQPVRLSGPQQAMRMGIAYLPEDRKTEGLFLPHSIRFNLSFATLRELSGLLGTIRIRSERNRVQSAMQRLRVKAVDMHQPVRALSGGNQQKVVLAKWLERRPKILLLNDPTRGIDVGTKREIYELLREITLSGVAVVLVSSNTLELIGLCDRVMILYEHQVNGVLEGDALTEENLVRASVLRLQEDVS